MWLLFEGSVSFTLVSVWCGVYSRAGNDWNAMSVWVNTVSRSNNNIQNLHTLCHWVSLKKRQTSHILEYFTGWRAAIWVATFHDRPSQFFPRQHMNEARKCFGGANTVGTRRHWCLQHVHWHTEMLSCLCHFNYSADCGVVHVPHDLCLISVGDSFRQFLKHSELHSYALLHLLDILPTYHKGYLDSSVIDMFQHWL